MRILLIEDDESIREVFKMILESDPSVPGLSVATAASGQEALEQARSACPELVLLDMTLEGEDGFEVFEQLRALPECSAVPVIAVTAHNVPEMQRQALDLGFAGFVTKPIDFEASLFPIIRNIVASKAA